MGTSLEAPTGVVRSLLSVGEQLPEDISTRIIALGPEAVDALLEIALDDQLDYPEAMGEGWAPIHAARLLMELGDSRAIKPLLNALSRTEPGDYLYEAIVLGLPKLGAIVLEPALASIDSTAHPSAVGDILSKLRIKDDRIYKFLLGRLKEEPVLASMYLADYDDPAAIPHLIEALRGFKPETNSPFRYHDVIEFEEAIRMLGGDLPPDVRVIYEENLRHFESDIFAWRAAERSRETGAVIRSAPKLGRNEPCRCGSGKKYKKCCLASSNEAVASP